MGNPLLYPSQPQPVMPRIKFRRGDIVMVKATVRYNESDGKIHVDTNMVAEADDVTIISRRFSVGETVRSISPQVDDIHGDGKVIAVHGDNVWVDFGAAQFIIRSTHLYVPEPDPEPETAIMEEPVHDVHHVRE